MYTNSNCYITFHNLSTQDQDMKTATFYRDQYAEDFEIMATMLYHVFKNEQAAKGRIEAMICADPKNTAFIHCNEVSKQVCNAEYHYHIDFESMTVNVLHHEYWHPEAEIKPIWIGYLTDFINRYRIGKKTLLNSLICC